MIYTTIPQFVDAHQFDGDIDSLQLFLSDYGDAYAMVLPKPSFKEDAIITSTEAYNSTTLKVVLGQYVERTEWGFFSAIDAADFEAKYQLYSAEPPMLQDE